MSFLVPVMHNYLLSKDILVNVEKFTCLLITDDYLASIAKFEDNRGRGFHLFSFMSQTIFQRTQGVRCVQIYTG